jgi:hypothetical protein
VKAIIFKGLKARRLFRYYAAHLTLSAPDPPLTPYFVTMVDRGVRSGVRFACYGVRGGGFFFGGNVWDDGGEVIEAFVRSSFLGIYPGYFLRYFPGVFFRAFIRGIIRGILQGSGGLYDY